MHEQIHALHKASALLFKHAMLAWQAGGGPSHHSTQRMTAYTFIRVWQGEMKGTAPGSALTK